MNTLIRIKGYILNSSVIAPDIDRITGNKVYRLSLMPESPSIFDEIEELAREAKRLHLHSFVPNPDIDYECRSGGFSDRLFKEDCVLFESLFKPKLDGSLAMLERDEMLVPRFVQVVGHVQIQEYGNVFLSFHIVEPALQVDSDFNF
jgi:hypothetical protein